MRTIFLLILLISCGREEKETNYEEYEYVNCNIYSGWFYEVKETEIIINVPYKIIDDSCVYYLYVDDMFLKIINNTFDKISVEKKYGKYSIKSNAFEMYSFKFEDDKKTKNSVPKDEKYMQPEKSPTPIIKYSIDDFEFYDATRDGTAIEKIKKGDKYTECVIMKYKGLNSIEIDKVIEAYYTNVRYDLVNKAVMACGVSSVMFYIKNQYANYYGETFIKFYSF